jgi:CRP/FNR family transcriptional regulator
MDTAIQEKLKKFFQQYKQQHFKKGDIIIRADESPRGIFYLTRGSVKQYVISQKGEEVVVNVFKPISFFPMSWAVNETNNMYYFEAVAEVEIHIAPKEDVVAFIKSEPDVLYDLLRRLYSGVDGLLKRLTYLMAGSAYSRLIIEMLIQAKRFGSRNGNMITLQISESSLANQAGLTRETVSRELHILKNKGLVTYEKGVATIGNVELLEKEVSDGV